MAKKSTTKQTKKQAPHFTLSAQFGHVGNYMLLLDSSGTLWKVDGVTGKVSRVEQG